MDTPDTWEARLFAGVCQVGCLEGWGGWPVKRWRLRAFLDRHWEAIPAVAAARVRRAAVDAFCHWHPEVVPGNVRQRWPEGETR